MAEPVCNERLDVDFVEGVSVIANCSQAPGHDGPHDDARAYVSWAGE